MATTSKLRQLLHRKSVEYCAPCGFGSTAAGTFMVSDKSSLLPQHDTAYFVGGVSAIWNYNADQDAWMQLPNSGIAGTFAAGACGEFRACGAPGGVFNQTAAAGGTTTKIVTALNLARNLVGCTVQCIQGTNVGWSGTVVSNTMGASSVLTVTPAASAAFDATSVYRIISGSLWFMNAGTVAVGFSVYDRATNTWTARSVTNLPTAWGTDAQLVSTSGIMSNAGTGFVNATSTGSNTTTTLNDTAKTWPVNGFTNFQVRIKSGTGAGQIRSIASNTATALTVSAAWTITPDATSVYVIEGNDDYFYLFGNNAVTAYRFTVSSNTWAVLAPTAARAAAMGAGGTADWIDCVKDTLWSDGTYGAHYSSTVIKQNGRYIYSFRGGASNVLDLYDIAANTWISGVPYGNQMETFTTGSCSADVDGKIYIQKDATARLYVFDVAKNVLEPFALSPVPQGAAVAGDKMFIHQYYDGGDRLTWLYSLANTRSELARWLVI